MLEKLSKVFKAEAVDASELYPSLATPAGEGAPRRDNPSTSKKKKSAINARVVRTTRKPRRAWQEVETRLEKHRAARRVRAKMQKESRKVQMRRSAGYGG